LTIRPATHEDRADIWRVLEPAFRAGETYPLERNISEAEGLAFWLAPHHAAFVAVEDGRILGTYFLRANQSGAGSHVANCGYVTAPEATGRGVASAMCAHSLDAARARGFRAMQFNYVVSTNERAVALWRRLGFEIVGRLPGAFAHPAHGFVDALVMFREL